MPTENLFLNRAYQYYDENKMDSAYFYFNGAKEFAIEQKDSINTSNCLILMGMIATNEGDYFGAQDLILKSLSYLNKKDTSQYGSIEAALSNLGNISFNLEEYDQAIDFYKESLSYSKNNYGANITKNALANAYREKKQYKEAIKIQQGMLIQKMDEIEYARILSNLNYTKWLNQTKFNAQTGLLKALTLRLKNNDTRGLNASFSHLADYYENTLPDSALSYAKKMLLNAINNKNVDDQLDALQKLIRLSEPIDAKKYLSRYIQLHDSLSTSRNTSKNRFALIRYQTEKHKADNIVLQKDNTEKKYQIIIISIVSTLFLAGGFLWYRKRQQHTKLIAEKTIKENQLKTSKKVHDVVANGLYRVMAEIENQTEIDKEHILDKIEVMYEKSRDISYEPITETNVPFEKKLNQLLNSFTSTGTEINIKGNTSAIWQKTNISVKHEIENILQELMVNMAKHSQANQVYLSFEKSNREIVIHYYDNGVGMPQGTKFKNGLTNTGNRIEDIHGCITFETQDGKGLKIKISFPAS